MILDQTVVRDHPATSGYKLDFFVNGFDPQFSGGSGQFTVNLPNFGVDEIFFEGKETLFQPVASLGSLSVLEGQINISGFLTGDINNSGILNVKNMDVYTGSSASFSCDTVLHSNRISRLPVTIEDTGDPFQITVNSGDLTGADGLPRFNENFFFKVVPVDFLIGRNESAFVSGEMGGVVEPILAINQVETFIIERSTATDFRLFFSDNTIPIIPAINFNSPQDSQTVIVIKNDVPFDFEDGLNLSFSSSLTQSKGVTANNSENTLTVPNFTNQNREFGISMELDAGGNIAAAFIEAGI
jgi:hypothetical protein